MKLLTTESQRHREIENQQDPRTAAIIGAAIEVHRQLLTYLKLSGKKGGLLINFNSSLLTQGIIRRVL